MKKAILILIAVVGAFFIVANIDYLAEFVTTIQGGALIPIVVSVIVMLARHIVQAMSYDAAFDAVGKRTGLWHNIVLRFVSFRGQPVLLSLSMMHVDVGVILVRQRVARCFHKLPILLRFS